MAWIRLAGRKSKILKVNLHLRELSPLAVLGLDVFAQGLPSLNLCFALRALTGILQVDTGDTVSYAFKVKALNGDQSDWYYDGDILKVLLPGDPPVPTVPPEGLHGWKIWT